MKKLSITILLLFFAFKGFAQEMDASRNFDPSFVHTVFFWLKNPDSSADRADFEIALATLLRDSKFAKTNFVGVAPKATRDVVDDSFTYQLTLTFESAEAQEGYQTEVAHLKFIEDASSLWEKVVVYDAQGAVQ
ncbi:Dabb family protein [Zeaxanthinibacter sp. PT1]|uniref:Dabb family protein n=1 Tax=Zeaxanthinibacter TaxID=561554 RepID=UPI00234ABB37|nr:Dabb family protein [Zeaxanthinibacter sp. PT1]MDC6350248.1 Dabb family protein [Zeaxanthinibacter sp. PT1]